MGLRVGQAFMGECSSQKYAFIETSYPFKKKNNSQNKTCVLFQGKHTRSRPRVANIWGVVVLVRNPYHWLDDLFTELIVDNPDWDSFIRRYSHMWRAFVEHWVIDDIGSFWSARFSISSQKELFEEGPRVFKGSNTRYFIIKYDTLMHSPIETAMKVLQWSKEVIFLDGLQRTQLKLIERAGRCSNYGNVVGRMASSMKVIPPGLGMRFKADANEPLNSSQWLRRRLVLDHTLPYFCLFGNEPPKELQCG